MNDGRRSIDRWWHRESVKARVDWRSKFELLFVLMRMKQQRYDTNTARKVSSFRKPIIWNYAYIRIRLQSSSDHEMTDWHITVYRYYINCSFARLRGLCVALKFELDQPPLRPVCLPDDAVVKVRVTTFGLFVYTIAGVRPPIVL